MTEDSVARLWQKWELEAQKHLRPRAEVRVHPASPLDRGRPPQWRPYRLSHCLGGHMGALITCRKGIYSAGATAPSRSFSTPLTRNAITAVANTNPSAITAVVASTRSKPPRP